MDYPDPDEFKDMLSDHVGMITALTKRGDLTLHDFQQVHRPLPTIPDLGAADSSHTVKEVAITQNNLTVPTDKAVVKAFETADGGSLLTQSWGSPHDQKF